VTSYFVCKNCAKKVSLESYGTRNRNHCPFCLYSLHVDMEKGDRHSDGEEMLVHECMKCGFIRWNRVAGDDSFDEIEKLAIVQDPRKL